MKTIIYLYNQQVQIITVNPGNPAVVGNCCTVDSPEGTLINGMVIGNDVCREEFREFLVRTWADLGLPDKEVVLIINSSKFIGKMLKIPKKNISGAPAFIRNEYPELDHEAELLCGYIPITEEDNGNTLKVYAEAIELDVVGDYVKLFDSAGIRLCAVYSGKISLIGFAAATAARKNQSFDLILADDVTITTLLFVNGTFDYYNEARCFYEQGSREYADAIAASVSQMIQFLKAQRMEAELECVILAGIDKTDIGTYRGAIEDAGLLTSVSEFTFPDDISGTGLQNFIHALAGLFLTERSENFLSLYHDAAKRRKRFAGSGYRAWRQVGAVFVIMLLATLILAACRLSGSRALREVRQTNEDVVRQMDLALYDAQLERNQYLYDRQKAVEEVEVNINTYPLGDKKILDRFEQCAKGYASVSYSSFDAAQGTISILAMSDDVGSINRFIANLTKEPIFRSVDYTGYTYDGGSRLWRIHVTCILAESAGKELP